MWLVLSFLLGHDDLKNDPINDPISDPIKLDDKDQMIIDLLRNEPGLTRKEMP